MEICALAQTLTIDEQLENIGYGLDFIIVVCFNQTPKRFHKWSENWSNKTQDFLTPSSGPLDWVQFGH